MGPIDSTEWGIIVGGFVGMFGAMGAITGWLWTNLGGRINFKVNQELCAERHRAVEQSIAIAGLANTKNMEAISKINDTLGRVEINIVRIATKMGIEGGGGLKIVIDPGHGGTQPGAIGILDGVQILEKNLNLAIALKLKDRLHAQGHTAWLTHDSDIDMTLQDRCTLEHALKPDCFVSIHNNADPNGQGHGFEIEYVSVNGAHLADAVLAEMKSLPLHCRGCFARPDLWVLNHTNSPAIMVEVGFMTNQNDLKYISQSINQITITNAIASGITKWKK